MSKAGSELSEFLNLEKYVNFGFRILGGPDPQSLVLTLRLPETAELVSVALRHRSGRTGWSC